jgi:hypothetical protein
MPGPGIQNRQARERLLAIGFFHWLGAAFIGSGLRQGRWLRLELPQDFLGAALAQLAGH